MPALPSASLPPLCVALPAPCARKGKLLPALLSTPQGGQLLLSLLLPLPMLTAMAMVMLLAMIVGIRLAYC